MTTYNLPLTLAWQSDSSDAQKSPTSTTAMAFDVDLNILVSATHLAQCHFSYNSKTESPSFPQTLRPYRNTRLRLEPVSSL
ncbi:hypothetical protein F5148DRAFT_1286138 [Russula earlei]|uniref:Uncharacterized protein n=1 Tax=Russula earlei TaxID=71964 RepID=A0ACC0U552_9AGAM|nr:hypothetical protein F5148DRAFT_1286138 [Russula earlei]